MPTNVTAEYISAEQEYLKATTTEEKLKALGKMLSTCPTHKGCEKLRQEIKTKIAKIKNKQKKELEKKRKGKQISIKKEGAATICLMGPTNSGKSLLLNKLTNSKVKVADYEFTTKEPQIGIMSYKGLKIQVIELPSIFEGYSESEKGPQLLSILRQADLILIVTHRSDIDFLFKELEKAEIKLNEEFYDKDESWISLKAFMVINKKDIIEIEKVHQGLCKYYAIDKMHISALNDTDIEKLKNEIWKHLELIKIYTKEPGKKPKEDEPLCLRADSTIENMCEHIHKDFIKKFRFARVWGKSAKFRGQQVGLKHKLEDDDIVEIHLR